MSRTRIALLAAGAVAIGGCGSTPHFADHNRPPTPVDLTVYINNARVSVSPAHVGAGPVIFFVTNQASKTESLSIHGGSGQLATTGPINPESTAQVTVNFNTGEYTISTSGSATNDAALAAGASAISPATLHIGAPRPSADNALLQP